MADLLNVTDLKKYFKTPNGLLHAVDGVTFSLREGQTLGVVGESGCGKSTLGRVLLGLIDATDGVIEFQGTNITNYKGKQRRELQKDMQLIFQDPFSSLNPRMCVFDLIADPLKAYHICKSKAEQDVRVRELMNTVGLAQRFAYSYPHELDGGRRQRIGVARALALRPKFIVCDEPVSALDVSIQAQILNLLMDLQNQLGLSYVFITHDMSVVKHISDDILVMYVGTMVEKAPSRMLFQQPLHPYTKGLLTAIPIPKLNYNKKRIILKGEISSPINPKPGCRFVSRCDYCTQKCHDVSPTYEEILPNHFVACHNVKEINHL